MSWRKLLFKELIHFPPKISLTIDEVYDFIPMDVLTGGFKFVKETESKTFNGSGGAKFGNGDTIFARITPCLENGKIAKVDNLEKSVGFGSTEFFVFRAIKEVSDPDFIYYLAKSDIIKQPAIKSMVGASGRQRADKGVVEDIEINCPPLLIQQKIGSILSAYDDLIENNLKRIKLLEEAAQNIYKEWFVNFRFPGYELAKHQQGFPDEWCMKTIGEIGYVVTGKTPSTTNNNYFGKDIPFIKTPDMHQNVYMDDVEQYLSNEGADSQRNKFLPKNTVIISCIGARAGVVALTSILSQTNQQINAIVVSIREMTFWLYFLCKGLHATINAIGSSGATMTNVSKGKLENIEVLVPPETILLTYHKMVEPMFSQVLTLQIQNQKLKEARDILLPRLMNQTIEVA